MECSKQETKKKPPTVLLNSGPSKTMVMLIGWPDHAGNVTVWFLKFICNILVLGITNISFYCLPTRRLWFSRSYVYDIAVSHFLDEFLHDQSSIRHARVYVNKYKWTNIFSHI